MHPLATPKVSTAPLYFTFHGGSIEIEKVTSNCAFKFCKAE